MSRAGCPAEHCDFVRARIHAVEANNGGDNEDGVKNVGKEVRGEDDKSGAAEAPSGKC